jgi:hypothetical protein
MLSETSQAQNDKYHLISFNVKPKMIHLIKAEIIILVTRTLGEKRRL